MASLTGQLTSWIGHHGAYAVFAIMALDALLPVGGELTMLFAGALAAGAIAGQHPVLFGHQLQTGLESYLVLATAGTLGYLFGSLVGWAIGRWGGRSLLERHGRWLHVTPENLDRAERWFDRHGRAAVFLGRLTPVVRSFISIPAGTLESPLGPYTAAHARRVGHLVLRLRRRRLGAGVQLRAGPPRLPLRRRAGGRRRRGGARRRARPAPAPRARA